MGWNSLHHVTRHVKNPILFPDSGFFSFFRLSRQPNGGWKLYALIFMSLIGKLLWFSTPGAITGVPLRSAQSKNVSRDRSKIHRSWLRRTKVSTIIQCPRRWEGMRLGCSHLPCSHSRQEDQAFLTTYSFRCLRWMPKAVQPPFTRRLSVTLTSSISFPSMDFYKTYFLRCSSNKSHDSFFLEFLPLYIPLLVSYFLLTSCNNHLFLPFFFYPRKWSWIFRFTVICLSCLQWGMCGSRWSLVV